MTTISSEVHLTRAQKWDLARLAAAAVASTVFFSVPMFVAPARSAVEADTMTPSVRVAANLAIVSDSEPIATSNPAQANAPDPPKSGAGAAVISKARTRISRPVIPTSGRAFVRPAQVGPQTEIPSTPTQPATLSRRLARFIAGDGKYGPKPFPTVGTPGM